MFEGRPDRHGLREGYVLLAIKPAVRLSLLVHAWCYVFVGYKKDCKILVWCGVVHLVEIIKKRGV